MKRILIGFCVVGLLFLSGCAELALTGRMMAVALMELFRLPVYCVRLPFQMLQSLGPMLQSAVQTGARLAPLLLFIERRAPKEKMYAEGEDNKSSLDRAIVRALGGGEALPLLPLMESELAIPGITRFILVDRRLLLEDELREIFVRSLEPASASIRCVPVDGAGIFSQRRRFLDICSRMSDLGASLYAVTPFNEELAAITGTALGRLPSDEDERVFISTLTGRLEEYRRNADSKG